nr:hypothetical protein [Tanacetum cinerariifolium]
MSPFYEFICYACGGPSDTPVCYLCTCEKCGNILIHGTYLKCNSGAGNSFTYDPIPESFNEVQIIPNPPPQSHFNIYLCQICESNSHYGYEYSQRASLVYGPKLCYNQNFGDNSYSHDSPSVTPQINHHCCYKYGDSLSDFFCHQCTCEFCENGAHDGYNCPSQVPFIQTLPSFPQQYPCCENCGAIAITLDLPTVEPKDSLRMGDEHLDTIPEKESDEFIKSSVENLIPNPSESEDLSASECDKNLEEKRIEAEQTAKAQSWKFPVCYDDDDDEEGYNSLSDNIISELPSYSAVTPTEPIDSLSMGDEHLNTILATESDEFIKSCVESLVPNPSESNGESGCDVPAGFTTFSNVLFDADYDSDSSDDQLLSDEAVREKIYSNPLFHEEIIPMEIDPHSFNAKFDLIESMPNHDSSVIISSKIDSLFDEFADELTLLKSIPPGINETDCHPEKEIRLTKRLLYDNSSPRPPEEIVSDNSNADIESFSPSPIPNKDSDPLMEEIDLSLIRMTQCRRALRMMIMTLKLIFRSLTNCLTIIQFPFLPMSHTILIFLHRIVLLQNHQMEKSPDLLSHQGFEAFQPSAECPMTINGKNIPLLDVPLFYFYPFDQPKYGGN